MKYYKLTIFILIFVISLALVSADSSFLEKYDESPLGFLAGLVTTDSNSQIGVMDWYPVEQWEIDTCRVDFSNEFTSDNQVSYNVPDSDNRLYDLTFVVNPKIQNTFFIDENGTNQYLFSIGWYLQGFGNDASENVKYKIKLKSSTLNKYLDLGGGETEKEITLSIGTSGFYSNYTTNFYESVELYIDNNLQGEYDVILGENA